MQIQTKTMKDLIEEKWNKRPLIISGPCSAETEEQVLETATRLAKTGKVDMFVQAYGSRVPSLECLKALAKGPSLVVTGKKNNGPSDNCGSSNSQAC